MTTPQIFANVHPWDSVFQKSEHEVIARNIMTILSRTGNTFRPLSWEEYAEERKKDGNFSDIERKYFDDVVEWCTIGKAPMFSKSWWAAAQNQEGE